MEYCLNCQIERDKFFKHHAKDEVSKYDNIEIMNVIANFQDTLKNLDYCT